MKMKIRTGKTYEGIYLKLYVRSIIICIWITNYPDIYIDSVDSWFAIQVGWLYMEIIRGYW